MEQDTIKRKTKYAKNVMAKELFLPNIKNVGWERLRNIQKNLKNVMVSKNQLKNKLKYVYPRLKKWSYNKLCQKFINNKTFKKK